MIESVYPDPAATDHDGRTLSATRLQPPSRVVAHAGRAKIVLAVDLFML